MKVQTISISTICVLIILLWLSNVSFAQINRNNIYDSYKEIYEKGSLPSKHSLTNTIESPVNLLNGSVCFDIPLYCIEIGDFTLPISLHYETSGFKVSDVASEIGLGWNISAGGCISRTIKGIIDTIPNVGYSATDNTAESFHENILDLANCNSLDFINGIVNEELETLFKITEINGNIDAEPDIYTFDFAGYTGCFIYDMDNKIHFIPEQNFKIEYTNESVFIITVDNGDKYYFGECNSKEILDRYNNSPRCHTVEDYESDIINHNLIRYTDYNLNYDETDKDYTLSWHLSKIEMADSKRTITFEYEQDKVKLYLGSDETYMVERPYYDAGNMIPMSNYDWVIYRINRYKFAHIPRLKKIIWDNGFIIFEKSDSAREDIYNNPSYNYGSYSIKQINIFNNDNLNYTIYLDQGYFAEAMNNEYAFYYKRLKLNKLLFLDKYGQTIYNYEFNYNINGGGCSRNTSELDYWGYYKKRTNVCTAIKPMLYYYEDGINNHLYKSRYSFWKRNGINETSVLLGNDMSPDINYTKVYTLSNVKTPTGGTVSFEYENNDFYFDNRNICGPGVRVKSVTYANNHKKDYTYKDHNGNSSGRISSIPNIGFFNVGPYINGQIYNTNDLNSTTEDIFTSRQVSTVSDMRNTSESMVKYELITESCSNATSNIGKTEFYNHLSFNAENDMMNMGDNMYVCKTKLKKTKYYNVSTPNSGNGLHSYIYDSTFVHEHGVMTFTQPITSWCDSYLKKKMIYDNLGNLIESNDYRYSIKPNYNDSVPYIQSRFFFKYKLPWGILDETGNVCDFFFLEQADIMWGVNYYKTGTRQLDTIRYTKYKDGVINTTLRTFKYYSSERHFNYLKEECVINSDGNTITNVYTYPFNYDELLSTTCLMNLLNMNNKVIEKYTTSDGKVIGGELFEYALFGNGSDTRELFIKPQKKYRLYTNIPLNDFTPSVDYDKRFGFDERYDNEYIFNYEEKNANMIESSDKNGRVHSYLWGYNNKHLIAEIRNVDYNEIVNALPCTIEQLQNKSNEELINIFQTLRITLPHSLITSYTYDDFDNLISITDPSGRITKYEYDNASRLKITRDANGDILQKYEYHYK